MSADGSDRWLSHVETTTHLTDTHTRVPVQNIANVNSCPAGGFDGAQPPGRCAPARATATVAAVSPAPLERVTLTGEHVRLEPLLHQHIDALVDAAAERSTYGWTTVPAGRAAMERYVDGLLADHAAARVLPFAQVDRHSGQAVGCTRFLSLQWFAGRVEPDEVEIGGTWLAAAAQRTGINSEAKLLLLGHAFDALGVWRVQICTDSNNTRSRAAIERLGATFEGVLRNHRLRQGDSGNPDGGVHPRHTACYSITAEDWPAVRAGLHGRLAR